MNFTEAKNASKFSKARIIHGKTELRTEAWLERRGDEILVRTYTTNQMTPAKSGWLTVEAADMRNDWIPV